VFSQCAPRDLFGANIFLPHHRKALGRVQNGRKNCEQEDILNTS
jgi:hypothetical protein